MVLLTFDILHSIFCRRVGLCIDCLDGHFENRLQRVILQLTVTDGSVEEDKVVDVVSDQFLDVQTIILCDTG